MANTPGPIAEHTETLAQAEQALSAFRATFDALIALLEAQGADAATQGTIDRDKAAVGAAASQLASDVGELTGGNAAAAVRISPDVKTLQDAVKALHAAIASRQDAAAFAPIVQQLLGHEQYLIAVVGSLPLPAAPAHAPRLEGLGAALGRTNPGKGAGLKAPSSSSSSSGGIVLIAAAALAAFVLLRR